MKKKAFITGITGQDAAYLAAFLLSKGYEVYGGYRRSSELNLWRLKQLGIKDQVKLVPFDLLEPSNIWDVIQNIKPDEFYNLAAQSFVGDSFKQPIVTCEVDGMGVLRILDALKTLKPDTKFYQASTSEMFGKPRFVAGYPMSFTEDSKFYPRSPYGCAKQLAHSIAVNYRESYGMFTSCGILFNHESPLRGAEFVTKKVTKGVAGISYCTQEKIIIGNVDTQRDWGYAGDYVEAMWKMLQQSEPSDYVIATGETHSLREFIEIAFAYTGRTIQWQGEGKQTKGVDVETNKVLVETSEEFYRPADLTWLKGDSSKARRILEWSPKTSFSDLIYMMVNYDIEKERNE